MAHDTTFTQRLVLVHKRAPLLGVTFEARFVLAEESNPAAFEALLHIGPPTFHCNSDMWIVAISATHFAFQHRMMMRQLELRAHFQVTLETSVRRFAWIDDRARRAAALNMQTSRAVTRLATHVLGVLALRLQTRMRRRSEIARDIFVTGFALLRANELRTRNTGRRKNRSACGAARKQNDGERDCSPNAPKQLFAFTVHPPS